MAIKIQALRRAFFDGEIIRAGQVLTIKGNTVPTWAKRIGKTEEDKNEEVKTPEQPVEDKPEQPEQQVEQISTDVETAREELKEINAEMIAEENAEVQPVAEQPVEDKEAILNKLLDESCEKGILVEGLESMNIDEQIAELEKKLAEVK